MQIELCYTLNIMLPVKFLEQMNCILGEEFEAFVESYDAKPIKSLRINTLKGSVERFLKVNDFGVSLADAIDWCKTGFYVENDEVTPGKHPLHSAGAYYIQEASAMSPVEKLMVNPKDRVLDLCAAPGGKSTQIACKLDGEGILVSNEPVVDRARILSENIERMGIANALVVSHDPKELSAKFENYFDKILVDAPCSGEGMFRKNSLAIDEWSYENVLMCAKRQKDILSEARKMLKSGGRLVYSTCTFSTEENEDNADWFSTEYEDILCVEKGRIWPHKEKGEGHFYAVFQKTAGTATEYDTTDNSGYIDCGKRKKSGKTDKLLKEYSEYYDFEKDVLKNPINSVVKEKESVMFRYGDELYLLPKDFPDMRGFRVIRSGLHLGTLKKGRFEPSHALALLLNSEEVNSYIELSIEDALKYLKGETIVTDALKGWCLVTYEGYSLGWGKVSNGIMKNHYPKGLRLN